MRNSPYFKMEKNDPCPLFHATSRKVRFEEVDSMNIVWHGRYPSYLEDARVELGNHLGIGYNDFKSRGYAIPIVRMNIDYLHPLHFEDIFLIEAKMHYTPAARLNISYVLSKDNIIIATAWTVQLIVDYQGRLCLAAPEFYYDFCARWKNRLIGRGASNNR
jgi:acyl-CoA thioester hydrolase